MQKVFTKIFCLKFRDGFTSICQSRAEGDTKPVGGEWLVVEVAVRDMQRITNILQRKNKNAIVIFNTLS